VAIVNRRAGWKEKQKVERKKKTEEIKLIRKV
jgi:hypothetical protein